MVKLIPDSKSVKEITEAVAYVLRNVTEYNTKFQVVGLNPLGVIEWYQNWSAIGNSRALWLATYTKTKNGIQVEYAPIVQEDFKLFAQFEEALRVALLNSSTV